MKQAFIILYSLITITSSAQIDVGGIVKRKSEERATQKIENGTDKVMDETENGVRQSGKKKEKKEKSEKEEPAGRDASPIAKDVSQDPQQAPASANQSIRSYAKYDFVPGDTILFEDHFIEESTDEIPSYWVPTGGVVEIAEIDGEHVAGFLDGFYTGMFPRMKQYAYLPKRFSVEFDVFFRSNDGKSWQEVLDRGQGAGIDVIFHNEQDEQNHDLGDFGKAVTIYSDGSVYFGGFSGKYKGEGRQDGTSELADKWLHIALAVTEKTVKVYLNNERVLNAPITSGQAASIWLYSEGNMATPEGRQMFIRNVSIASGGKDPYKRLSSESKFIARGIKFDYNKATLKPESMGEINAVFKYMSENHSVKYEIGGHTDSDGEAAYNLKLSADRAEAVKAQLVEMGINPTRLTAKGYGETTPLNTEDTPDAKANNRRVEFSKF